MVVAASTESSPTNSEIRLPYTTRLNTSRPKVSVPNQCDPDGSRNCCDTFWANGSCGAICGAKMATSTNTASRTTPKVATGWLRANVLVSLVRLSRNAVTGAGV